MKEIVPPEEMEVAVFSDDKQTREENIRQVTEKLKEAFADNEEWLASIMFLVFVVLGGIGNMRGSIIAAVILNLLPELLRGLSDYRMLFYAIVLIVMMLINWAPKAIEMRERFLSRFKKKEA